MWKTRSLIGVTLLGLMLLFLSGCGKVSKTNYDKIEIGMTVAQVEAILGKGKEESSIGGAIGNLAGSAKVITWGNENKSITVTFVNEKVSIKAQKGL